MHETGVSYGAVGSEIGFTLVRASPFLSLIGGPSSTRYCRQGEHLPYGRARPEHVG